MKLGNDPQSALALTWLERAVLQSFAMSLGADAPALHAQAGQAQVVSRSHSGVGFVTRLAVPESLAALPPGACTRLRAVRACHPRLREPAEFLVQLKGGRLASIEAYCPDGMWPADDAAFRVEPPAGH